MADRGHRRTPRSEAAQRLAGFRAALAEAGRPADRAVPVPDDLAVVGFGDNVESAYGRPSLTSVAPDKAATAHAAVTLLRRRVDEPDRPPEQVRASFALRIRESTLGG